jgi:hypothetical protein
MFVCLPDTLCFPLPWLLVRSKTQDSNLPAAPRSVPGRYQCPTNLPSLTTLLLRDLPSYANRATQRRRRKVKDLNYSSYLLAGQPDLNPIAIANPEYSPAFPQSPPQQLFISTLEKQFQSNEITELQKFHWLFLTYSNKGSWNLALMYSRLSKNTPDSTLLPSIDSSQTPLGEAVSIWLRDCRAGFIKP